MKNEYGESNANLNLNIEAEPEPEGDGPTFVEKPRIQSQNQGKLVIMDCKVKANPKPEIVWTHAGKIVKESSKISISIVQEKQDIYYIKLTLNDPGAEDSGLYKCNIKNALGELNANLTLNVESEFRIFLSIPFNSSIPRANPFLFHSYTRDQGKTEGREDREEENGHSRVPRAFQIYA